MVTYLGPGIDRKKDSNSPSDRTKDGACSKAGRSLLAHINQYVAKGFAIKRVISDGEPSIKAVRSEVESLGIELTIFGHGSHTPHAESMIRHVKNKARSTFNSLEFPLAPKLPADLITFVVHTANMVPKINAIGHLPADTAFLGRVPNFARDAPHAFGTAGFLQRAQGPTSNSALPRGDYCIWLGTTHNIAGTHRCLDLDTLLEKISDVFSPALLTTSAINHLSQLAGVLPTNLAIAPIVGPLHDNPTAPDALDPDRGVINFARRQIVVAPQQLHEFLPLPPHTDQPVTRNHEDLTDIGRAARIGMNAALSKSNRFFHLYTKSGSCKPEKSLGAFDCWQKKGFSNEKEQLHGRRL
jgi:hypothetical protein